MLEEVQKFAIIHPGKNDGKILPVIISLQNYKYNHQFTKVNFDLFV